MNDSQPEQDQQGEPSEQSVRKFLLYSLSLPERTIRGTSGLVGGAIKHSASLLIPTAFQDSRTYTVLVRQTLDFMIQDMAGVKPAASEQTDGQTPAVDQFVARKTVGSFLDLAGMATLHLSPMLVLAVFSDVAYGSRSYLKELSQELKERGLIDEQSSIDSTSDLLDAVALASGVTATAMDAPPISVDGLRETISQTREAVTKIDVRKVIPQAEMARMWSEMHEIATKEGLDVMEVSSAMTLHSLGKIGQLGQGALSGVRVAGNLFDRQILSHYRDSMHEIKTEGFYKTVSETSAPYIAAVWENFSGARETWTEQLLNGQLWNKAAGTVQGWWGKQAAAEAVESTEQVLPSSEAAADSQAPKPSTKSDTISPPEPSDPN